jgi:catechol O-methyltransferase
MQAWRFLTPRTIGYTLKNFWHASIDKLAGKPARPTQTVPYVAKHAERGNPADVLRTLDRFAREERWLMSVGPEKGPLINEVRSQLPDNPRVLEFGAYCGYSSILIADLLGPGAQVTSVEINEEFVAASRANVDVAGLANRVAFLHSASSEAIPTLQGPFDMVFLDHWKQLYLEDLQSIEEHGLLRPGSIVVADNVGEVFGAEAFLDYIRNCGKYRCENRTATIEYTNIPDAVEIAVYQPGS